MWELSRSCPPPSNLTSPGSIHPALGAVAEENPASLCVFFSCLAEQDLSVLFLSP